MKLTLSMPKANAPLKEAVRSKAKVVVIESAPLKSTRRVMAAWFLAQAASCSVPGRNFVWLSPNPPGARRTILSFIDGTPLGKTLIQAVGKDQPDQIGSNESRLWFVNDAQLIASPVETAAVLVVEDAHDCEDPHVWAAQAVRGHLRMFGEQSSDPAHWWSATVRQAENKKDPERVQFFRVTITDDINSGAIHQDEAKEIRDSLGIDRFRKVFLLERPGDKKWEGNEADFEAFARDRLYVVSKKPIQMLSERQQRVAKRQGTGVPLLPMDFTSIQQQYLKLKADTVAGGKRARFLVLKYRQGGISTIEQAQSYHTIVTKPRSKCVTLAHTDDSTRRIFEIAQRFYKSDPYAPAQKTVGNAQKIHLADNDSQFVIGTAGGKGIGRGETWERVHGSEVAQWGNGKDRIEKVDQIMAGLLPGADFGEVVLETTPQGVEWFAQTYMEAKEGGNDWTPIFFRWFDDPLNRIMPGFFDPDEVRDTMTEEERELVEDYKLDESQISFRRQKKREQKRLFPQEYPEDDVSCFLTSGTPYFDLFTVAKRIDFWKKNFQDVGKVSKAQGATTIIWEEPEEGVQYVLGADTSEGLPERDPSGLGVMRRDNGNQVASVHGEISIPEQSRFIHQFHLKYNKAVVGVERNNHGHAVVQRLIEKYGMKGGEVDGRQKGPLYHFSGDRAGWETTSVTRPIMLSDLSDALETRESSWRDRPFLDEAFTFKLQSDGQFRADPGAHDDRVMKWAIAEQMRKVHRRTPQVTVTDL